MDHSALNHLTPEELKKILQQKLPGSHAHITMLPPGRELVYRDNIGETGKESAVLVLLFKQNERLMICLTLRPRNLRDHAGQISFPGGKKEKFDNEAKDTALREAREEIGIDTDQIEILGQLSPLYVSVSNFIIEPVVGWVSYEPLFEINYSEVENLIVLPLHIFLDQLNLSTYNVLTSIGELEVPCYKTGDQIIWGATAMIISELAMLLRKHYFLQEEYFDNRDNNQALC